MWIPEDGLDGVRGHLQRLWILVHGGNLTALLSAMLGLQCVLDAGVHLGDDRGDHRSTLSAMNAAIVLCGACYQRFWARDRHAVTALLGDLLRLAARLERQARGEVQTMRIWMCGTAGRGGDHVVDGAWARFSVARRWRRRVARPAWCRCAAGP